MDDSYNYKAFAILYVDDESESLYYFSKVFEPHFRILVAKNAEEGFRILDQHKDEIGLLMTDERMPGEGGVQLLQKARELRPRIVRVLATAYSDIDTAIRAVNTGAVYRYVSKPWDVANLEETLKRGLEFFIVQRQRDQLLKEKVTVLRELMISDRLVSLGILATGLSHHLRNSLVAIRTFIDLTPSILKEENLDSANLRRPEFWNEFYETVQKELQRITDMLTGLGTISGRSRVESLESVNVDATISRILGDLKPRFDGKSIAVEVQFGAHSAHIHADRTAFARLVELLLTDESIHLPHGSVIRVRTRSGTDPENGASAVFLEIEDNGPGLSEEERRLLFDPFFLRSDIPHEHGMNLMTCFFLVHHHDGKIEVKGAEPQGTIFTITLPVNPKPSSNSNKSRSLLQELDESEAKWESLISGGKTGCEALKTSK